MRLLTKAALLVQRRRSLSHEYGCGPIPEGQTGTAPITMFRHALLHHFQLTLFSKLPLKPMTLIEDVRTSLGVSPSPRSPLGRCVVQGTHSICAFPASRLPSSPAQVLPQNGLTVRPD